MLFHILFRLLAIIILLNFQNDSQVSGDLYIKGSDKYSDYREQLLSWEEYEENKVIYGQQVNLPVESKLFIDFLTNLFKIKGIILFVMNL